MEAMDQPNGPVGVYVEGTRPSKIDPVSALNTARVSERVTQEKSSSFN